MADLDIDALIAAQAPQFFDPFDPANNPTPLILRSLPGEEGRPRGLLGRVLDYAENGGGAPQTGPTAAPAGYQNLDPTLASRVLGMVNASNGALPGVRSGFRSYGEQAELYRRYLAGEGAPANPPGHSLHERGDAADVNMRGNQGRDGGAARGAPFGLGCARLGAPSPGTTPSSPSLSNTTVRQSCLDRLAARALPVPKGNP